MRRLLLLLTAAAAAAVLAWVSMTAPPAPDEDEPEGGSHPGRAVRIEQPEMVATDAAQANLGAVEFEGAGGGGTRATAELETLSAGELVAFVLAAVRDAVFAPPPRQVKLLG